MGPLTWPCVRNRNNRPLDAVRGLHKIRHDANHGELVLVGVAAGPHRIEATSRIEFANDIVVIRQLFVEGLAEDYGKGRLGEEEARRVQGGG